MKRERLELARRSGNVFRDLGREHADIEQLKALLAAEIIKALDRDELTVRGAHGGLFSAPTSLRRASSRSSRWRARRAVMPSRNSRLFIGLQA